MKTSILLVDTKPNFCKGIQRIVHRQRHKGNVNSAQRIDAALDLIARAASDTIHGHNTVTMPNEKREEMTRGQ